MRKNAAITGARLGLVVAYLTLGVSIRL